MFCCCRGQIDDTKPPPILDVEKVLTDHVWDIARNNFWKRKFLRRSDYIINVPMNFFHFETISKPNFIDRLSPQLRGEAYGHIMDPTHRTDAVEIATDFVNDTDREQTYKFRLEKTRKSSLNVTVQKGFSIGGRTNISIGLPKIASAGVQADVRFNITKTEGETIEQTVLLETTSDIKVKDRSKYVAKAILAETRVSYDFSVWSRVSLPTGRAPVSVIRKSDKKVLYSASLSSLKHIFEKYEDKHETDDDLKNVRIKRIESSLPTNDYVVEFKTQGIIDGVRLSDQRIKLESSDLGHQDEPVIEEVIEEDGNVNRV